jgi:hypothetical protein
MDQQYQAVLERFGGLPPHAFTTSSQASNPPDVQDVHGEAIPEEAIPVDVDHVSSDDSLLLLEEVRRAELALTSWRHSPADVSAIAGGKDHAIGINNPFPETWSSFEDDLVSVQPIDPRILGNDPASSLRDPCGLVVWQQLGLDSTIFGHDIPSTGQNLDSLETSTEARRSESQLDIPLNQKPDHHEGTGAVRERRPRFSKEDREMLNDSFAQDPYPSKMAVAEISRHTRLTEVQVNTWFTNKRSRTMKQGTKSDVNSSSH